MGQRKERQVLCAAAVFAALAAMLIMYSFHDYGQECTFLKSTFSGKCTFVYISYY